LGLGTLSAALREEKLTWAQNGRDYLGSEWKGLPGAQNGRAYLGSEGKGLPGFREDALKDENKGKADGPRHPAIHAELNTDTTGHRLYEAKCITPRKGHK